MTVLSALKHVIVTVPNARDICLLTIVLSGSAFLPAHAQTFVDITGDSAFADITQVATSRSDLGRSFTISFSDLDAAHADFGFLIDVNYDSISSGFAHTWTGFESDYRLFYNSAFARDSLQLYSHSSGGFYVADLDVDLGESDATVTLPASFLSNEIQQLSFGVWSGSLAPIGSTNRERYFTSTDAAPENGGNAFLVTIPEMNGGSALAVFALIAAGMLRLRRRFAKNDGAPASESRA